jgi:hypothetical protein
MPVQSRGGAISFAASIVSSFPLLSFLPSKRLETSSENYDARSRLVQIISSADRE